MTQATTHAELFQVVIAYNGPEPFREQVPSTQVAEAAFRAALKFFQLEGSAGTLGLFYNGQPLNLQASLASQGVPSGATIVLQARVVRNG